MIELLNSEFTIKEIDIISKKFTKYSAKVYTKLFSNVSRFIALSDTNKMEVVLDINSEIYNIDFGDTIELLILKLNQPDESNWNVVRNMSILDSYEYVMHGIIFHSGKNKNKFFIYASFGGLLMKIFGNIRFISMENLVIDTPILLLIRKKN